MTTNRRLTIAAFFAATFLSLLLPVATSAQGYPGPWQRGRDRDVSRDRNQDRYDHRALRNAVHRVEDRSEDFEKHLDRALDRSRYDDTRREDRINDIAKEFRDSSRRLKSRFNDGRDLNRSADEARRLLQIASRIDRLMERNRLDSRAESDWNDIRYNLRVIADGYGLRIRDSGYGGRGGYDPYGGGSRRGNDDWWRRIPLP